jgi:hypothetical protein
MLNQKIQAVNFLLTRIREIIKKIKILQQILMINKIMRE